MEWAKTLISSVFFCSLPQPSVHRVWSTVWRAKSGQSFDCSIVVAILTTIYKRIRTLSLFLSYCRIFVHYSAALLASFSFWSSCLWRQARGTSTRKRIAQRQVRCLHPSLELFWNNSWRSIDITYFKARWNCSLQKQIPLSLIILHLDKGSLLPTQKNETNIFFCFLWKTQFRGAFFPSSGISILF